jgi:serine/threonine-protein kinase HipA
MTSECFVYIALPGQTQFVTAGRFAVTTDDRGTSTGQFVYGRSYRERSDAVPIDPLELKLAATTYKTVRLGGVFGALRDGSPDSWGRRIIERRAGKSRLNELDYMLLSPDDRAGALGFGPRREPSAAKNKFNRTIALEKLQAFADAVVKDEELPEEPGAAQAQDLMGDGTSMGGARPKAVVEDDDALWVAKFNRPDDGWNHARVERAMLQLARACGLETAESKVARVGDRDLLLVKRFDRERTVGGYRRARLLSALTLLRAEDESPDERWSYVLLAEELRRISGQPKLDAPELFRRMCFNALISNTDDHPRNHAVIAMDADWKLSPAYDLLPSMPVSTTQRDLAMICGDRGRYANADNLLTQCPRFLLAPDDARKIIDTMEDTVTSAWHEIARREGVREKDCETISTAFAYGGFRLEPAQTAV